MLYTFDQLYVICSVLYTCLISFLNLILTSTLYNINREINKRDTIRDIKDNI
jgi:hypothetical protein